MILEPAWLLLPLLVYTVSAGPEENEGVRYANRCEACKILATELQERLQETGKSHDVLEVGYSFDDVQPKKRTEYRRSELRLIESLENVCERVLAYNLHKERTDSTRFAKGMSQTFETLHGLVNKGVKVDLGIPYELWDNPPVEVTHMKSQCEKLVEQYEDTISDWYFKLQDEKPLLTYLCEDVVLAQDERNCLTEQLPTKVENREDGDGAGKESKKKKQKSNIKGDTGKQEL